jgi:tRNA nucleotidyltransferase (CCA-adding enzyme)
MKALGCDLLKIILERMAPKLLIMTGLTKVYESALLQCLKYLPPSTPTEESSKILRAAYPAIRQLSKTAFPTDQQSKERGEMLHHTVSDGLALGFTYASENIEISTFLLEEMTLIVKDLGLMSIQDLKVLMQIITQTLSAPFATTAPQRLSAAAKALRTLIVCAWPRIHEYKGEIVWAVCVCEDRIRGEENQADLIPAQKSLQDVCDLLVVATGIDENELEHLRKTLRPESRKV